jgi:uncharacterized protein (DUF1800 family)
VARSANLDRRSFLRLAALVAASGAASACLPSGRLQGQAYSRLAAHPEALSALPPLDPAAFAVLRRLTFGPTLQERQAVAQLGPHAWIEEQLALETIDDSACELRLRAIESLSLTAGELADWSDKLFDEVDRHSVPDELAQAALLRQLTSRRQLYERMVDFWSDHFNISTDKGECYFLKTVDDREVIRPHALGRFGDLLQASAHSPAMLVYLDNQANQAGNPNENYAREVLELHTLGVDGGYTQRDVMELARCLTGWTVNQHFWRGQFTFRPAAHDSGPKLVLGIPVAPGGLDEAEGVLARLAQDPATARLVCTKLVRRFIADPPPLDLVQRAAEGFGVSGGDLRQVLRLILLDGLPRMQLRFTRPAEFVVSALRQLHARLDHPSQLLPHLRRMGQPYFAWPSPDGYPDHDDAWRHNLLPRWQFALSLSQGELPGVEVPWRAIRQLASGQDPGATADVLSRLLLGAPLDPAAKQDLLIKIRAAGASDPEEIDRVFLAGLVASPAFLWR